MSIRNLFFENQYNLYANTVNMKVLESNIIKTDNIKLESLPMAIKSHVLYYNVINGEITYGLNSGGGNLTDPLVLNEFIAINKFTGGNINVINGNISNNLKVGNIEIVGGVISDIDMMGMNINNCGDLNVGIINTNDISTNTLNSSSSNILLYSNLDLQNRNITNINNLSSGKLTLNSLSNSIQGNVLYYNPVNGTVSFGIAGNGGGGGPIPDPLSVNQLNCNIIDGLTSGNISFLNSVDFNTVYNINRVLNMNSQNVNCGTVNSTNIYSSFITSTNIISNSSSQLNNIFSSNITNTNLLTANIITANSININSGLDLNNNNIIDVNALYLNSLNGISGIDVNNFMNLNSNDISGVNKVQLDYLEGYNGNIQAITNIDMNDNIISNVSNLYVQTLNYVSLNPPVSSGVQSTLFFNRKTAIPLNGAIANANQINFTNGTSPTDWETLKAIDFSVAGNAITYSGSSKDFYVQCSFAVVYPASSTTVGFELRKNGSPISSCRFLLSSNSQFDGQDFNFVSLNNGDSLTLFYNSTNTTSSLSSTGSTGLTTTKPLQIYIREI